MTAQRRGLFTAIAFVFALSVFLCGCAQQPREGMFTAALQGEPATATFGMRANDTYTGGWVDAYMHPDYPNMNIETEQYNRVVVSNHYIHYMVDISEIPDNAVITAATLHFNVLGGSAEGKFNVAVCSLGKNFTKSGDSYSKYDGVNSWTNSDGGKSDCSAAYGSSLQELYLYGDKNISFNPAGTAYLQGKITAGNKVYLMLYASPDNAQCPCKRLLWQSEAADNVRPYLEVKYTTGGGGGEGQQYCSEGTAYGSCSSTAKPKFCSNGSLVDNCSQCGCNAGFTCDTNGSCKIAAQTCSDGTAYGSCSTATKPKKCVNGSLVDSCSECGCAAGFTCDANGSCKTAAQACSDGTANLQCSSAIKGKKCANGSLIDACAECGCPANYSCQGNGTCALVGGKFNVQPRPRLLVTQARLANIKKNEQATGEIVSAELWRGFKNSVDRGMKSNSNDAFTLALAVASHYYKYNGAEDRKYCDQAILKALAGLPATPPACYYNGGPTHDLAVVYDLCHDYLSAADMQTIKAKLETNADAFMASACHPDVAHNYAVHKPYALMAVGLALYGDSDKAESYIKIAYDLMIGRTNVFLNNLEPDGLSNAGQQYGPITTRELLLTNDAIKTGLGEDHITDSVHYRNLMEAQLFGLYPNIGNPKPYDKGKVRSFAFGDYFSTDPANGDEHVMSMVYYALPSYMLLTEYFPQDGSYFHNFIDRYPELLSPDGSYGNPNYYSQGITCLDALFYNPALESSPVEELGLARNNSMSGYTVMRKGWGQDGVLFSFRAGLNHSEKMHLDQGGFQILAGRAPDLVVSGGGYSGSDDYFDQREYAQRTVSSSGTFLVYDESEDSSLADGDGYGKNRQWYNMWGQNDYANDGGQRGFRSPCNSYKWLPDYDTYLRCPEPWNAGKTLRFEAGDKYFSYVAGDLSSAYLNMFTRYSKLPVFEAENVFLRADNPYIVIFDRTKTISADLEERWLMHSIAKPEILDAADMQTERGDATAGITTMGASRFKISYYGATLDAATLLPADASYRLVGGTGYECWQDELQQNICPPEPKHGRNGDWRLEVSSADNKIRDSYLHVMKITPSGVSTAIDATLISASGSEGNMYGALIKDSALSRVVIFSELEGTEHKSASYSAAHQGRAVHLLFNMKQGTYTIRQNGTPLPGSFIASPQGVLEFEESGGGNFEATMSGAAPPTANCTEGEITGACKCGGVLKAAGFCCSNVWQSTACAKGCAQGEVLCSGVCKPIACVLNSDCAAGQVCARKAYPCYAKCVLKFGADTDGDGTVSLQELLDQITTWKGGSLTLSQIIRIVEIFKAGYYESSA